MPTRKNSGDKGDDSNKTVGPNRTVLSSPEVQPTLISGETHADPAGDDPNATLKPSETVAEKPSDAQLTSETVIAAPDAGDSDDSADTIDESSSASPENDHPTAPTILSTPDHQTDDTLLADGTGKRLEDHFETLREDPLTPGTRPGSPEGFIIGDYQVLSELGRGGMGVVYKARHRKLNRDVALKMILQGNHAGSEALERFIVEARAVAHLQHPGIVQIFDIGEHEQLPYFSLEFVDGSDLQKKLDRQPQDPKYAAEIVAKLAEAMQYAHENGILHRDLKPPNVLLDSNGEPKITDFGLAKQVDGEEASTGTTMGTIMGSPSYMPPEQARGEVSSLTPRSDLYSLGAILYEMLTGRPPFLAQKPLETVMQVVNSELVSPRDLQPAIPVDIETICMKAMQKEQGARYESCSQLAEDLKRFLAGAPILARPVTKTERLVKWCKRNPKVAVPSALALLGIVSTAIVASWAWQTTAAQAAVIAVERDNAQDERDEAEKQKNIAQLEREKAEQQALFALQNIQFVLTDVDTPLAQREGLSDLRILILEALCERWDKIDVELAGGLDGQAVPTFMAVRFQLAKIFESLDELQKAEREFVKLTEKARERIKTKDGNDATRFNLAHILSMRAPLTKRLNGNSDQAVELLTEAVGLMDDIFENPKPEEGSPSKSQLLATRAMFTQNLGVERLYRGELAAAVDMVGRSLEDNGRQMEVTRELPEFKKLDEEQQQVALDAKQQEYNRSALTLAYLQLRKGSPEEALELYDTTISSTREIYERRPEDQARRINLAGFLSNQGRAYLWLDRAEDALKVLMEAAPIEETLHERDPEDGRKARQLATTYFRLGIAHDLLNQPGKANEWWQKCRDVRAKLVAQSDDIKNQVGIMLVDARLGNLPNAKKIADQIQANADATAENDLDRARSLAQISRHTDDEKEKAAWIDKALSALERAVSSGYSEPFRIENDNDLDPLHDELRFQALVAKLKTSQ